MPPDGSPGGRSWRSIVSASSQKTNAVKKAAATATTTRSGSGGHYGGGRTIGVDGRRHARVVPESVRHPIAEFVLEKGLGIDAFSVRHQIFKLGIK